MEIFFKVLHILLFIKNILISININKKTYLTIMCSNKNIFNMYSIWN